MVRVPEWDRHECQGGEERDPHLTLLSPLGELTHQCELHLQIALSRGVRVKIGERVRLTQEADWSRSYVEEGGRFAAIRTRIRRETELVGIGVTGFPARLVDRAVLSVTDVEEAMARDDVRIKAAAELAGFPLCIVSDHMTSEEVLETVTEQGVLAE